MKNAKRIVSLLLVLVMALGLFTGCKKKDTASVAGDGKITVGIPGNATIPDLDTNGLSEYLEEATGLDIEWVEFASGASNYTQQITLMFTGGEELPDVLVGFDGLGHYTVNQYGEDGYIIDLSQLIEDGKAPNYSKALASLPEKTQKYVNEKGTNTVDGKSFFAMPTVTCPVIDDQQSMMYINQKWLDAVGMKAPTNVKELEAVCQAFLTQDPNGNGEADEYAMLDVSTNAEIRDWLINAFVEYNSANFNVKDGKVWDPIMSDEYRQALQFVNKMTKAGYYNELSYTLSNTEVKNLISPTDGTECKVGIFGGHMETCTNASTDALDEFVCLKPLADETGKGGYNIINDVFVSWDGFITSSCKDVDEAMMFLDAFYVDECVTRQRWGVKGQDWTEAEGENWFGEKGYIKVLNANAFFDGSLNATLGNTLGIMTHENYLAIAETAENSTNNRQIQVTRLIAEQWDIMNNEGKKQEDTLENLVYTQDEYDYRESKSGTCESFIKEQSILLMQGEKDINDDGVWNEFKSQVEKLERSKMMKIAQDAYNRKIGK